MTTTERSINVFVDGSGVFDAVVARSARAIVEKALADLEKGRGAILETSAGRCFRARGGPFSGSPLVAPVQRFSGPQKKATRRAK